MHPIEIIELMIVGGIFISILFVSYILKGKWRKIVRGFAVLFFVSFGIIYFIRPYWIDMQIEKKVGYIQIHLEERYPEESWEYRIVPHREEGYEHLNPYYIGVIFESEPHVEYKYFVRNKDEIVQRGWYTSNSQSDLFHLEE